VLVFVFAASGLQLTFAYAAYHCRLIAYENKFQALRVLS